MLSERNQSKNVLNLALNRQVFLARGSTRRRRCAKGPAGIPGTRDASPGLQAADKIYTITGRYDYIVSLVNPNERPDTLATATDLKEKAYGKIVLIEAKGQNILDKAYKAQAVLEAEVALQHFM